MTTHEFALPDLAARLLGTEASLSTSLRNVRTLALQELIEAELAAGSELVCGDTARNRRHVCRARAVG